MDDNSAHFTYNQAVPPNITGGRFSYRNCVSLMLNMHLNNILITNNPRHQYNRYVLMSGINVFMRMARRMLLVA